MPINTPEALNRPLDAGVRYLLASAAREGKSIGVTSGLRTRDEQLSLRVAHCGPSDYDKWEKPSRDCNPPTAIPGTSRHETGDAVDLNGDLSWAYGKLSKHGFTRPVGGEPWHFEHPASRKTDAAGLAEQGRVLRDLAQQFSDETGVSFEQAWSTVTALEPGSGSPGGSAFGIGLPGFVGDAAGLAYRGGSGINAAIANPLDALAAIGRLGSILLTLEFWRRLGLGLAGVVLLVAGAVVLNRETLQGVLTQ